MKEIFIKKIEGAHKCIMHDMATQKHKYTHKKGQSYPVSTVLRERERGEKPYSHSLCFYLQLRDIYIQG